MAKHCRTREDRLKKIQECEDVIKYCDERRYKIDNNLLYYGNEATKAEELKEIARVKQESQKIIFYQKHMLERAE